MVSPNVSNGCVKRAETLAPAVVAATIEEPRELTALCNKVEPIAVMENCSPIGIPIPRSLEIWNFCLRSESLSM